MTHLDTALPLPSPSLPRVEFFFFFFFNLSDMWRHWEVDNIIWETHFFILFGSEECLLLLPCQRTKRTWVGAEEAGVDSRSRGLHGTGALTPMSSV